MVDAEQWDLLRALANAYQSAPDSYNSSAGIGGEVFMYIDVGEDQFVRHPGLADGNLMVRAPSDMQALMDRDWIRMRQRDGRSYTFVVTPGGLEAAETPPD